MHKIKLKEGDILKVTWIDHHIETNSPLAAVTLMRPTAYESYGLFMGEDITNQYLILAHNKEIGTEGPQDDHTLIIKSAITDIEKLRERKK